MVAPSVYATMHVAMVIVVARGLKTEQRPRIVHSRLSFDSLDRCLTMVLTLAIFIYSCNFFFFPFFFNDPVTLLFLCYTHFLRFLCLSLSLIHPSFFSRSLGASLTRLSIFFSRTDLIFVPFD